jgi:hypothetical protein
MGMKLATGKLGTACGIVAIVPIGATPGDSG